MVKGTIDLISFLMDNYRKLAMVILMTFFGFPFISIAYLVADNHGYLQDENKKQHALIQKITAEGEAAHVAILTLLNSNAIHMKDLITINRGDCLNGAKTRDEMNRCLPPVYKNRTELSSLTPPS